MRRLTDAVRVEIDDRIEPVVGFAAYRSAEYSLVYERGVLGPSGAWRQSALRVYAIAGFVTLTFDGMPFVLTALDAYANDAKWAERELALPPVRGRGALVVTDERLDGDRMSIDGEPVFEVDRRRATIRIRFADDDGEYFEIGTGLFAEIVDGRLASLILTAVRFE